MDPFLELSETQFEAACDLIYRQTGIRVADGKRTLLSNRIRRRVRAHGFTDFETYLTLLNSPPGRREFPEFIDEITTNETFFFRSPVQFDWLRKEFVQEISLQARRGLRENRLRVWSAACSTGEEPYSIAVCLLENRLKLQDWKLEVLGTDISDAALEKAREGLFKQRAVEAVTPQQLRRYFKQSADDGPWQVKPAVRELVEFEQHNLLYPLQQEPFDCIFLRNVLIYFDTESKKRVVRNLCRQLADGGYLVLGPSEGVYDMLSPLNKRSACLFQKGESPTS